MAGLLAAHALADHSDLVTIVERDSLPAYPENRPGAVQGRHAHALLARGQQLLEAMFPGFTEEIAAAGARTGDVLRVSRLHFGGHRLQPATSGLTVISASRALLEHHVRSHVLGRPEVEILDGSDVVGLVTDVTGSSVGGVRLVSRSGGRVEETLDADVVVDATGRTSRSPTWLGELGVAPPPEDRIAVDVTYATRRYRMDAASLDGDLAVICAPTPAAPRMGGLALLEDDVGMLTVGGLCGDRPRLDPDGFTDFARSLAVADIAAAVTAAEPLDDPIVHRFPASTWRHYDRSHLPSGFAVIGDGVCSVNPIYGQGMTIAALEAAALDRHLGRERTLLPRRLQRELAGIIRPAWQMAAGADLQHPDVEGRRRRSQRLLGAYISRLHRAAAADAHLSRAFVHVSGLVEPPSTLLRPSVLLRVLHPKVIGTAVHRDA
jgi:2-polyprenyl-6-methoxyphenol hydroxylase-like FAD-dependent oxidoreductase